MEEHLKKKSKKTIFNSLEIVRLRDLAVEKVKAKLLPNEKILKIVLIGSSVKDSFGQYEAPGFRGSLFSDFDFIVFVEDNYEIPNWLEKEPAGRPFSEDDLNLAFRNRKLVEGKYDIEVFFIRRLSWLNPEIQKQGELAGIPMTQNTNHKYILVYEKSDQ